MEDPERWVSRRANGGFGMRGGAEGELMIQKDGRGGGQMGDVLARAACAQARYSVARALKMADRAEEVKPCHASTM